ncbi:MAG: hypothetical protein U0572_11320 [Phycisphaerales bacterium]
MVVALLCLLFSLVASSVLAGIGGLMAQVDWRFGLAAFFACAVAGAAILLLAGIYLTSGFGAVLVVPFVVGWGMPMIALAAGVRAAARVQGQARRVRDRFCLRCGYPVPPSSGRCPECGTVPP